MIEALEDRQLLSVSLDAAGWTVVTPAASSRVVFVSSSSGSDANAGTQDAPVASLARAKSLLRNGRSADSYLAENSAMRSQKVLLRVLHEDTAADPAFVRGFMDEVRTAALLFTPLAILVNPDGLGVQRPVESCRGKKEGPVAVRVTVQCDRI